jgi:hypothetical protein
VERFTGEEHSSLQGPFISYEENEVLWKQTQIRWKIQHEKSKPFDFCLPGANVIKPFCSNKS